MKILIVDDEPPARARLTALVEEIGTGVVIAEAANGRDALILARSEELDLVLLDIRMPGMDGLEVARHLAMLEHPPAVIFTTAFDNHALEAFDSNAVDYLLKPIRLDRLEVALQRATRPTRAQLSGLNASQLKHQGRTHISATLSDRLELVPVEDVRYFKAEHKYVTVGFPQGQLLIEESLNSLEAEFGECFLRVHRNALVAVAHVKSMERDANGRNVVTLTEVDDQLEVSRRMAASVKKVLKAV
ncbi:MAG: DNA-binding response regulator [Thiotrichales bacterium]|nr:DNA-binding response regulator [Thiotrichales bacterium]